jgi:hypothetical protein
MKPTPRGSTSERREHTQIQEIIENPENVAV